MRGAGDEATAAMLADLAANARMDSEPVLAFRNVDILFAGTSRPAVLDRAKEMLDAGRNRFEIAADTGVVVGVAGASLDIAAGEISVLMGLSGSGKSTLLRAANGLNRVTRGQVLLKDQDGLVDVARCERVTLRRLRTERIAMVFQQFALLPWRTVRENVGLGLELRGMPEAERRRIVDEKLRLVALEQWADRFAAELSGGMQQRVGLARALATDADILLMDEPFSALDPLIRTKLQDELLALQKNLRKTILFVTHDLDEALKLGNRISILEGGRIVQTGTPEEIVLTPADDYVAEFVQHMNPLTVLKGMAVMRGVPDLAREGEAVLLDPARHYRFQAGSRDFGRLWFNGVEVPIAERAVEGAVPVAAVAAVVPPTTPLRRIVELRQASGHPVLLAEHGRLVGVCDGDEILRALATTQRDRPRISEEAAVV
jgi:glycine betaine/proline transport system ATP-binding protein